MMFKYGKKKVENFLKNISEKIIEEFYNEKPFDPETLFWTILVNEVL